MKAVLPKSDACCSLRAWVALDLDVRQRLDAPTEPEEGLDVGLQRIRHQHEVVAIDVVEGDGTGAPVNRVEHAGGLATAEADVHTQEQRSTVGGDEGVAAEHRNGAPVLGFGLEVHGTACGADIEAVRAHTSGLGAERGGAGNGCQAERRKGTGEHTHQSASWKNRPKGVHGPVTALRMVSPSGKFLAPSALGGWNRVPPR